MTTTTNGSTTTTTTTTEAKSFDEFVRSARLAVAEQVDRKLETNEDTHGQWAEMIGVDGGRAVVVVAAAVSVPRRLPGLLVYLSVRRQPVS